MGIDPGFVNTGFGVVGVATGSMRALDAGVIESAEAERPELALNQIRESLAELIRWHEPDAIAIERLYFNKNVGTAMGVGQARGVVMATAAERGLECFDYTPQAVKVAVCGSGNAGKQQVQRMVASLLGLPRPPRSDHAADALAVAICHAARLRPADPRTARPAVRAVKRPRGASPQRVAP